MVLDNLIFFNEKGYEIPVQKVYTLAWEIIPNSHVINNFISNPKGHFMIDLQNNITVVIDDPGKILVHDVKLYNKLGNDTNITISTFNDICFLNKNIEYQAPESRYKKITKYIDVVEDIQNTVQLTINTLDNTITEELPIDIFSDCKFNIINSIDEYNDTNTEYYTLSAVSLSTDDNSKTAVDYLVSSVFGDVTKIYPCIRYIGSNMQDKVSTDFVSASTVIILEEQNGQYINPVINNNISMMFEFQNDSEMRFISSNSIADIIWESSYIANNTNQKSINTPVYFSVGFSAKVEGCYQNIMAMYIYDENTNQKYIAGLFTFLTEVEGEDERYRALLGNLGIPDPEKYSNIFKEQDHLEECVDWTLVNKKSKELMINYENIFPYAGTYKALLNAVKFLGYYDLIFKEWYKIKDQNNRDKYITLQTYDTSTGKSLKSKLKQVNVSFGEFERYKKLNRLTMVYHLNQLDEDNTTETLTRYNTDSTQDRIVFDVPQVKKIYEYRTDEILAKLYSVKVWLENHILGVNCYISDICGEGLIIERIKTQAYVTEHYVKDFYSDAYLTPKISHIDEFIDSSTYIACSLTEYNSVTFETYKNIPIETFIKKTQADSTGQNIFGNEYISNPIGCLLIPDEIQYELHLDDTSCGSLYEFMNAEYLDNPILVKDNKIELYKNNSNYSIIDNTECPIIEIAQANIRYTHGNWKSNIKYSININQDKNTGNEYYTIQKHIYETTSQADIVTIYKDIQKVFLYPHIDNNPNLDNNSQFIYTANNQWNVPIIVIRNYTCPDIIPDSELTNDYILEIVKGKIIFRNKQSEINDGLCTGAEILFGYEDLSFDNIQQSINISYTYSGERVPVFTFNNATKTSNYNDAHELIAQYNPVYDIDNITNDDAIYFNSVKQKQIDAYKKQVYHNALTNSVSFDPYYNIKVNRIGDYTVTVKGYDAYNRIYVNKSDKKHTVYAPKVDIELYINSAKTVNKKSFNDSTYFGEKQDNLTLARLLNKLDTYPKYPRSYRIYDIDPMLDTEDQIQYDNISYALDVPTIGDYIVFNNFTERVVNIIKVSDNSYKLMLLDGNPNPDTIRYANEIGLCLYDNNKKEIITDIFPLTKTDLYIDDKSFTENNIYDSANSYMTVETANNDLDVIVDNIDKTPKYLYNNINAYVYNATSMLFTDLTNLSVDYNANETYIQDNVQRYKENDVIKLSYLKKTDMFNNYVNDITCCNEACYKIKRIYTDIIDNTEIIVYVLDGIFDLYKLNNKIYNNISEHSLSADNILSYNKLQVTISPAHLSAAQYVLRTAENGSELTYNYNGTAISRTQVTYEGSPLLFNSYLDTNYSAMIQKFEPKLLDNMWNYNVTFTHNDNIYKYTNVPVTIDKGRQIIIKYDEEQTGLSDTIPLKILWNWNSYYVEEVPNATLNTSYVDKHLIFQSINNTLSLIPNILGSQNIGLTLIDCFGNTVNNHGEGLLYVQNTDKTYVHRPDNEKLSIETPVKAIVAITFNEQLDKPTVYGATINNITPISAYGETCTVYLNDGNTILPKSGNTYPLNVNYTIYYSDGTKSYNKGAKLTLLDNNDTAVKNNKAKVKFGKAAQSHKHIAKTYKIKVETHSNRKYDMVTSNIIDVPVMQYGFDITTKIYNLRFLLYDVLQCGTDEINNEFLSYMIHDISYDMERLSGDIEHITGNSLNDCNLEIMTFKYIGKSGISYMIPENTTGNRQYIGIIQITLRFNVHGIKNDITATYTSPVYQE